MPLRLLHRTCYPDGLYWNYYSGTISLNQVTEINLKIEHPCSPSTGAPIFKWFAETWVHNKEQGLWLPGNMRNWSDNVKTSGAKLTPLWYHEQGCHTSGKSQGKFYFFKVRELSGNLKNCQGNSEKGQMSGKCQGIPYLDFEKYVIS